MILRCDACGNGIVIAVDKHVMCPDPNCPGRAMGVEREEYEAVNDDTIFTLTTAEDERDYFSGEITRRAEVSYGEYPPIPAGAYRVMDGKLYRIVSGFPEFLRSPMKGVI